MVEPPQKGLTREELSTRIFYIYEKIANKEELSKAEERIFAYHETAVECRCSSAK